MNTTIKARNRILSFALALCLLLTMVVYLPGPVEVSAALPSGGPGDPNDGINFQDFVTNNSRFYYGTYDHATKLSNNTWGTVDETEQEDTPILWRVFDEDDSNGKLTLWSEYVLDSQMFHANWSANTANQWAYSDLRDWLHNEMPNSFISSELALIPTDVTIKSGTGIVNMDSEANNQQFYLPWASGTGNPPTSFGLNADDTKTDLNYTGDRIAYLKGGAQVAEYWLRSPVSDRSIYALFVDPVGSVRDVGVNLTLGVRPAFQFNPSSVIFTSKIADGANITNGETEKVDGYYSPTGEAGRENFKLTVVNDSIGTLTGMPTGNPTVSLQSGKTLYLNNLVPSQTSGGYTVNYKIVNNTGRSIAYYGYTDAEAVTNLEIPGIADGDYTVYVWLQKNNDFNSHEGTTPEYFTLNVSNTGDIYDIALSSESDPLDFGSEEENYTPITPKTVSIATTNVSSFDIRLGGNHPGSFEITNDSTTGFDIVPAHGLGAGIYEATVTVAGNYAEPQTLKVEFEVTAGNISPAASLTIGNMDPDIVEVNQSYSKSIPVDYQNGTASSLTYTITGQPNGLNAVSLGHSGTITGIPTETGTFTVNVSVDDGMGASDSGSYTLEVTSAATATQLTLATPTNLTVTEGEDFTKTFSVTYTGTDSLEYTIRGLPDGVDYSTTTGEITGPANLGTARDIPYSITVEVTDSNGNDTNGSFDLIVLPASSPPPQSSHTITASAGIGGSISPSGNVSVADGDDQIFTITPNENYKISDVLVDDVSEGDVATYTFQNVTGDHTIHATFESTGGGSVNPDPDPTPAPSGSTRRGSSSGSGGSNLPTPVKTRLPASAFSWEGRTLTIDHDSITTLGLLSVQWDGKTLTRGTDYGVYQGSVIVRFSEDFMAAQSPGDHTVKVEFLNHTGETTVTVGETGLSADEPNDDLFDNNTYNPNTGGYPDGSYPATDNPNTGDGRGIWFALLLGSIGAAVLVKLRPRLEVK